jgi:hypothetical protein
MIVTLTNGVGFRCVEEPRARSTDTWQLHPNVWAGGGADRRVSRSKDRPEERSWQVGMPEVPQRPSEDLQLHLDGDQRFTPKLLHVGMT